jgi:hypothetical protein
MNWPTDLGAVGFHAEKPDQPDLETRAASVIGHILVASDPIAVLSKHVEIPLAHPKLCHGFKSLRQSQRSKLERLETKERSECLLDLKSIFSKHWLICLIAYNFPYSYSA